MTVIETHPEELLDRERDGSLTDRERNLLMAHLRRCSACRMERQLRVDFERELAVSAQSLDLQMFVSDAIDAIEHFPAAAQSLAAAHLPLAAGAEEEAVPLVAAKSRRRNAWAALRPIAVLMLACVALSAGVGIGAAQLGLAERAWQFVRENMDATFGEAAARRRARAQRDVSPHAQREAAAQPLDQAAGAQPAAAAQPAPKRLPRDVTVNPLPDTLPTPLVSAVVDSQLPSEPEAAPAEPQASAPADSASDFVAAAPRTTSAGRGFAARMASAHDPVHTTPREEPAARVEPESQAAAPAAPARMETAESGLSAATVASAARLFEEANTVRHQGHAIEASGLYRELQARFPNSAEARLSIALVARLQLDQGESAAALAGFEAYLASSDMALREEATVGRVRALQRLERTDEARAAAQTLLELYPSSAFAPTARKLLEPPVP